MLDNEVVTRPIINFVENPAGIDGRSGAQISGNFSLQEAQDLAEFLQIGALPIELQLISQSTVSATLGEEALDQGLKAGLAGLLLVLLFLIAYYRVLGVIAGLGLLVYAIFFYALIELIPITLTLPGIAGLILTIGVAADSNIVIFERIKEEARAGRSMSSAIAEGYRKGIATIIDANVITLITAFILFVLATSGVKGFAFTLGVGTIVSLFTAVVFTQAVLGVFGRARWLRSPKLLGASPEQRVRWHFDFTGASQVVLLDVRRDPADRRVRVRDRGPQPRHRLRVRHPDQGEPRASRRPSTRCATALADADVPNADTAEIQDVEDPDLGENVVQIQGELTPTEAAADPAGARGHVRHRVRRRRVPGDHDRAHLRRAGRAQRGARGHLLAAPDRRLHGDPVRGEVRGAGDDRGDPRPPDHGRASTRSSAREVSSATVAAFLTILGYSLYDAVIVFDRIRENVPRLPRAAFSQIVNRSMSEVLTRSLITGLSTVFLIARAARLRRRDPRRRSPSRCSSASPRVPTRRSSSPRRC